MNKEKQIEEMAKITCQMYRREYEKKCAGVQECDMKCLQFNRCEALYNAGYRKASEVIEEVEKYILEGASTIESNNSDSMYGAKFAIEKVVLPILDAFKKKYTEEGK